MNGKTGRMGGRNRPMHSLQDLSRELQRVNRTLRRLAGADAFAASTPARPRVSAASVRAIIAARRLRDDCFGPSVGEVGWAVLLEAYAARLEGRGAAMTSLGASAGIARSTAHRWAVLLLDRGLLSRLAHSGDERTAPVTLTDEAADRIRGYLTAALQLSPWLL